MNKEQVSTGRRVLENFAVLTAHVMTVSPLTATCSLYPFPRKSSLPKTQRNTAQREETQKEFSLFRSGIQPEWEDCRNHARLFCRSYFSPLALDLYWGNLVQSVIDRKLPDMESINGIRIWQNGTKPLPVYKFEIWLSTTKNDTTERIQESLPGIICNGVPGEARNRKNPYFQLQIFKSKHKKMREIGGDQLPSSS